MTAAGGLYLRKYSPYVATVFTTHATVTGRCVAGNGLPLYKDLGRLNAGELARQFNVSGQTLDREDQLAGTRRVLHRERNHRPRMREPAGQHGGRRHPQRLRGRLRVERQGVRRKTGRGTPRDDPHGRGDAELQIRRRTPDRRHERPATNSATKASTSSSTP